MIHLVDISKSYTTRMGDRIVLHPTTLTIPSNRGVAVLGRNGAGKSTLLRMISGIEEPDQGQVIRTVSLSWPLGFAGGVNPNMTGRQNIRFLARLNGADRATMEAFVEDFAELGVYLDERVITYSSGMRARLSFGISLAMDFDCYLVDEATSVGDQWFREKCLAAFNERRARSGLLMVSHNPGTIRQYCEIALVLTGGQLVPFCDLDEAVHFYCHGGRRNGG